MRAKTTIALLLLLCTAAVAQAVDGIAVPGFPQPYGYAGNVVSMGWYNATQAWFFCTATNDIRYTNPVSVSAYYMTLTPKLSSALTPRVPGGDIAARPVYMVTNFQNPPVFSAAPGQPLYSALWQVFNVTWKRGIRPRPITSADPASPSNPTGLPDATEATIVATQTVIDCPILALGQLNAPFPTNGEGYLIPQADHIDTLHKLIFIPAWQTYCQDPVTKQSAVSITLITDVSDAALASVLGANIAPGLLNLPDVDTTDFYVMREPKPLTQLPVIKDCPIGSGSMNRNYGYSPVMRYVILKRNIPATTLIRTPEYLNYLLTTGGLQILKDDQRINAPTFSPS